MLNPFSKPNITNNVEISFPNNEAKIDAPDPLNALAFIFNPQFPVTVKTNKYFTLTEFLSSFGGFVSLIGVLISLIGERFLFN